MTFENRGASALDYFPCRYPGSRAAFRGPRRRLDGDHVAFLGGTDTYGRFVPRPFPAMVEDQLGIPCVNFGWMNAGPDAFLADPAVMQAARGARAVVLQVPGAQNLTNRCYAVHPRRNDRFLEASPLMRKIFPTADFTEFHFTRHLLGAMAKEAPDRFGLLVSELQQAWVARMSRLISEIEVPVLLVWFAARRPDDPDGMEAGDPLFVTGEMLRRLDPGPAALAEAVVSPAALAKGSAGMIFAEIEAPAARGLLGPAAHAEAAEVVSAHLADLMVLHGA